MTFLKEVKTHTSLKPGQKGTKRLVEQYSKALLCVHYRQDAKRGIRLKTVELIVEESRFAHACVIVTMIWSPSLSWGKRRQVPNIGNNFLILGTGC
jgi:hypothetical protein